MNEQCYNLKGGNYVEFLVSARHKGGLPSPLKSYSSVSCPASEERNITASTLAKGEEDLMFGKSSEYKDATLGSSLCSTTE